jgi:glutamate synthase (NADPH/NADH) small chain
MGKVTGFLEYDRQEQKYQLAGERIRHFREFTLPVDTSDLRKQAARCMACGIPFCHGPTGCPVHNQIPDWNDLVFQDDWFEAQRNLHSTNNFQQLSGVHGPRLPGALRGGLHAQSRKRARHHQDD